MKTDKVNVFVASTFLDMETTRNVVFETLEKLKFAAIGMEFFGARSSRPLDTCLGEIRNSHVMVLLIGFRYGSIADNGHSFVENEYDEALRESLVILPYLAAENTLWPANWVDKGDEAVHLAAFKQKIEKNHTCYRFEGQAALAKQIETDLATYLRDAGKIDESKLVSAKPGEQVVRLLRDFDLIPAMKTGAQIELVIEFTDAPTSVPEEKCRALDLSFGAAVQRSMRIVEPSTEGLPNWCGRIYGSGKRAEFLIDAAPDRQHRIVASLKFGMVEREKVIYERRALPYLTATGYFGEHVPVKTNSEQEAMRAIILREG